MFDTSGLAKDGADALDIIAREWIACLVYFSNVMKCLVVPPTYLLSVINDTPWRPSEAQSARYKSGSTGVLKVSWDFTSNFTSFLHVHNCKKAICKTADAFSVLPEIGLPH